MRGVLLPVHTLRDPFREGLLTFYHKNGRIEAERLKQNAFYFEQIRSG